MIYFTNLFSQYYEHEILICSQQIHNIQIQHNKSIGLICISRPAKHNNNRVGPADHFREPLQAMYTRIKMVRSACIMIIHVTLNSVYTYKQFRILNALHKWL